MLTDNKTSPDMASENPILPSSIKSATPLTPLQLNAVKMDVKHTILTPDYLERADTASPDP